MTDRLPERPEPEWIEAMKSRARKALIRAAPILRPKAMEKKP